MWTGGQCLAAVCLVTAEETIGAASARRAEVPPPPIADVTVPRDGLFPSFSPFFDFHVFVALILREKN